MVPDRDKGGVRVSALKFSRFGKAPAHHHAAHDDVVTPSGHTYLYRLFPQPEGGYTVSVVPLWDGGEVCTRWESLGRAESFRVAKQIAQAHAEARWAVLSA